MSRIQTGLASSTEIATLHLDTRQQFSQVAQAPGDQVTDLADAFPAPVDPEQLRAHQGLALALGQVAPDHHVEVAKFIFQGDEGHAAGRARTLAAGDQPGDADVAAMLHVLQFRELRQRRARSSERSRASG